MILYMRNTIAASPYFIEESQIKRDYKSGEKSSVQPFISTSS